jgi:hypothetical protein
MKVRARAQGIFFLKNFWWPTHVDNRTMSPISPTLSVPIATGADRPGRNRKTPTTGISNGSGSIKGVCRIQFLLAISLVGTLPTPFCQGFSPIHVWHMRTTTCTCYHPLDRQSTIAAILHDLRSTGIHYAADSSSIDNDADNDSVERERERLEALNTQSFLKKRTRKLPYEAARKWIQANLGASTKEEFFDLVENGNLRTPYIPKRPDEYYVETREWISWDHFLTGIFDQEQPSTVRPQTGVFD